MSRIILVLYLVCAILTLSTFSVFAQETSKPKMGIGINFGLQQPYCDIPTTGVAPASEAFLRYQLGNRFQLRLGAGLGQLSDGFSKRTFHTNTLNLDLKGNIYLLTQGSFLPYGSVGIGALNHTYNIDESWAIGDPSREGKDYTNTMYLVGGGADIHLNEKFAINAYVDYRFTATDLLDGAIAGESNDGYLNMRAGAVYLFGQRKEKVREELIAEEGLVTEVEPSEAETDEETQAILEKLMGETETTEETTEVSDGDFAELQRRAQVLRELISEREQEIASMEAEIADKDARISQLQSQGVRYTQPTIGDFSTNYQEGLRRHRMRNYQESIAVFNQLKDSYPNHKLASNCVYWIGENYFMLGNYSAAITAFRSVLQYSRSYKIDDATLMLGRCYEKMGQYDQARSYFNQVISQYPQSEYVPKAQQWLARIQ